MSDGGCQCGGICYAPDGMSGVAVSQPTQAAAVAAIFTQVLRHAPVSAHDDFFDLGGDSILAIALMAEIRATTGQDLPITTIYDAPTPAALAALLAAGPPGGRDSCLVQLKAGPGTPLFIAHGLGGSVFELRELGRLLDTDGAVYGIEARGLDGHEAPLDRVEDMARAHLADIRRVQPSGPYRLAGFSFGGLVALEMAHQLKQAGETVTLLCLLDTFVHARFWPLPDRVVTWFRLSGFWLSPTLWRALVRHYGGLLRAMPPAQRWGFIGNRARRAGGIMFSIFGAADRADIFLRQAGKDTGPRPPERPELKRVQTAAKTALANYKPAVYADEIIFIKAADETLLPFDPRSIWRSLAPRLVVHALPGDHQALVRGNVARLAALLSAKLRNSPPSAHTAGPPRNAPR